MGSSSRHWSVSSGAALAAAAVHVMLFTPLMLGGASARRPAPDQPGAGASALQSNTQLVEAMTLVDLLHTKTSEETPLEELASLGMELPSSALVVASPELAPMPMLEEDMTEDSTVEAAGDTQGHAAMFGRYLGQISARIERAWSRPRTHIDASSRFSCQTKIEQDEKGKILSVELRHCNGDAEWQRSLVSAIEHASPLPAPPTPSVFARTLVLSFSSEFWQEGVSNAHLYEPEIRLSRVQDERPSQIVTNPGKTASDITSHGGNIELRIEGSAVRWTLHDVSDNQNELIESGKE